MMKKTKNIKIKTRVTWGFNPATRVVKSKKVYSRKNNKLDRSTEYWD
jgi:hypothetical protein